MGYITTRVIMENTLLTANATLPTYDRSALIPVSFILVLARFIALIRLYADILARARQRLGLHRS